jgi:hypothetical protein
MAPQAEMIRFGWQMVAFTASGHRKANGAEFARLLSGNRTRTDNDVERDVRRARKSLSPK